jgi:hypothetical protein
VRTPFACHSEKPQATRNLALPLKTFRARFLHFVQDRLFAEFTLGGRARFFAPLRMTSGGFRMTKEGLRMTAKGSE